TPGSSTPWRPGICSGGASSKKTTGGIPPASPIEPLVPLKFPFLQQFLRGIENIRAQPGQLFQALQFGARQRPIQKALALHLNDQKRGGDKRHAKDFGNTHGGVIIGQKSRAHFFGQHQGRRLAASQPPLLLKYPDRASGRWLDRQSTGVDQIPDRGSVRQILPLGGFLGDFGWNNHRQALRQAFQERELRQKNQRRGVRHKDDHVYTL